MIECDSVTTAHHIYQQCDGSEFEKSTNFLDLRFIPDEVNFEEDSPARDVCSELSKNYKPKPDICTNALQSTKVTLTWDADDMERRRMITRKVTNGDEEEADLEAFLASSSEDDYGSDSNEGDKAAAYKKLLLDGAEEAADVFGKKNDKVNELSITFASALREADVSEDDSSDAISKDEVDQEATFTLEGEDKENDTRVKTPFAKYLERRQVKKKVRKQLAIERKDQEIQDRKKKGKRKYDESTAKETAQLSLLLDNAVDDDDEDLTRKQQKKRMTTDNVDLTDDRFAAIYEESAFALDPSHPSFKRTKGSEKIIKERQRRLYK